MQELKRMQSDIRDSTALALVSLASATMPLR